MSTARMRNLSILTGLLLLAVMTVTLWAFTGHGAAPAREITLHARGMAFYLPGSNAANPTLRVIAGESVRVTVVNDDPGVKHDLEVAKLGTLILHPPGFLANVVKVIAASESRNIVHNIEVLDAIAAKTARVGVMAL